MGLSYLAVNISELSLSLVFPLAYNLREHSYILAGTATRSKLPASQRIAQLSLEIATRSVGLCAVVKLLSKRLWIPVGARLEGSKLESEGPRADVGFPTADQVF